MWYEILPSYLIITTFLSLPNIFAYYSNKLLLGQPFRRKMVNEEHCFTYLRDARLSDRKWAYDFAGLENIPDADEAKRETPSTGSSSSSTF